MCDNGQNLLLEVEQILLTPRETAKVLSISERTLYSLTVPRGDIPVIRASKNVVRYAVDDLKEWARQQYRSLEVNADACSGCEQCLELCPYGVPIPEKLKSVRQTLQ